MRASHAGMPDGISTNMLVSESEPPRAKRVFPMKPHRIIMKMHKSQKRFNKSDMEIMILAMELKGI